MTVQTVPDTDRSGTAPVTTDTARYTLDDWRAATAELNTCGGDEDLERATVLGRLMAEVRANACGGARPEQTRFVLALCDVYERRQRNRLGYDTVPELAALVGVA